MSRSALAIPAIALTGFGDGLGVLTTIGGERTTHVVALIEPAFGVASDVTFISTRVDQLALAR
jgi:hypothetical protein